MKTLIITGGSSGIGQAAALLFASRGWHVYELSRHDVYGRHTVSAGTTTCPKHLTCDVTDPTQCQAAVARQKSVAGSDVYPHAQRSVATMERDEQHGLTPQNIAQQLYRLATARYVSLSHVSGLSYRLLCFVERLVPRTLVNRVVAWLY